ncbi:hypothetical protein [Nocardia sp. alder85J]|uniref:hypothetical protein n=1 Tax=Nocardia sp. alder85J TaxID=2862949 RepID=UPI001CD4E8FA|nr:hypothetical protein [Nocardia sp. alder85J]MCX4097634.1 hypothetical protein [Nocardia sp. alder85J]
MKFPSSARGGEYGLLVAAATVADDRAAETVRELLRHNGIRATCGPSRHRSAWGGRIRVPVFPEDAVRAYQVLCRNTR